MSVPTKKPFRIHGEGGKPIDVPHGEFYFNTKARARRMCLDSLSSVARQVYACVELGSMGYRKELAVIKVDGKQHRLTVSRIAEITELDCGTVRRALRELENAGLVKRVPINPERPMVKGNVAIYCFAFPRPAKPKIEGTRALNSVPSWFPEPEQEWSALKAFFKRTRVAVDPAIEGTRALISEGEEIARALETAELRAREYADRLRAQSKTAAHIKERKERNTTERKSVSVGQSPAPEPDRPTDTFTPSTADRYAAIELALPPYLLEKLQDTPTMELLKKIDHNLAGAPLENFVRRIKKRYSVITELGLLANLAADVGKVWRKGAAARRDLAEAGEPGETMEARVRRRYREHPGEREWLQEQNPEIDFGEEAKGAS